MPIFNGWTIWVSAGLAVSHLLFAAVAKAQSVSFIARLDATTGSYPSHPQSVAVGDFNGDGVTDLAVANNGSSRVFFADSSVSVLLGNGGGTFQPARNFDAGWSPQGLVLADFNGDGMADLAVSNLYFNHVSVLLGNGDGTFQAPSRFFGVGYDPDLVAVGDFNGDSLLDLVVANNASNDVSVLINNTRR